MRSADRIVSAHRSTVAAVAAAECDDHADDLRAQGVTTYAFALTPRELAVSVTSQGPAPRSVVDADQVVTGFYVLDAPDMETAVAVAGTNTVVRQGGAVEVRPLHSGGMVDSP